MATVDLDGASGFLVKAQRQRAGMLLLPTIYGVNKFVREFADYLASAGLTTMIWDPYPGQALPASFEEAIKRASQLRDGPSLDSMSICIDHLMGELRIDSVGTMGFCLGGRFTLMLAAREARLGACAGVYPSIHSPKHANQDEDAVNRAGDIACPVQVVYPTADQVMNNETFFRLQETLQKRMAPTSILLYPGADHAFMHTPGAVNEVADRHARPLVRGFLEASLAPAK